MNGATIVRHDLVHVPSCRLSLMRCVLRGQLWSREVVRQVLSDLRRCSRYSGTVSQVTKERCEELRSISSAGNSYHHGINRVEEQWRQFFADPSQWWDHTRDKLENLQVNPNHPDFTHKKTRVGLWLDRKANPSWVKTELASMVPDSVSRSPFCWNAMIARCVKSSREKDAMKLYNLMETEAVKPDKFIFVNVLKACANLGTLGEGKHVHAQIIDSGCESDVFVGNSLVNMYSKCGSIADAERVFQRMPIRNVVSWNAMLAGYVYCEEGSKALELFRQMQTEEVKPGSVSFVLVLKACASMMALEEGKRVHKQVMESGCESDMFVGNTLMDMYAKCQRIADAENVFQRMPNRDVVSYNVMLAGYVNCEEGPKALELFQQMQGEVKPDSVSFVLILKACASMKVVEEGRQVHTQVIKSGCEADLFVGNTLVDMYAKCGSIADSESVFQRMPTRDVVSWNAMLAGYVNCEEGQKALELFQQMRAEEVKPDSVSFVLVLKACSSKMALEEGRLVHTQVIKSGWESDVFIGNTLVDMYAKCGSIADAESTFHRMPNRDVVSWNAMLAGYVNCEEGQNALELFRQMQAEERMPTRSAVSWNAMLGGFAKHGLGKQALELFQGYQGGGVKMDGVTFTCLLSACSHAGLVEEGIRLFDSMGSVYGVLPTVEHYVCMVDLLGRAGRLDDAESLLRSGPEINEDSIAFKALLGACRNYGKVGMGKHVG